MNQSSDEERLTCLVNLRAVVVTLIIVLHGSMIYMTYAPERWYVVHTDTSLVFTIIALVLDVPLFLILFFIAGYYVYPSLIELRSNGFMRATLYRIALPWIIGVFLLAPPVGYLSLISRNVPVPFALFLEEYFWKEYFTQSVYWFLGVLLILYGAVTLIYYASPAFRSLELKNSRPTWTKISLFLAALSAGCYIINLSIPLDEWRHYGYLIMVQPARVPLYVGYFVFGLYAFFNGWLRNGGYRPDIRFWIPLAVYGAIVYIIARILFDRAIGNELAMSAVVILTLNMFGYAAVMVLIGTGEIFLSNRNSFWRNQSRNWYGMYYIHPLILFPVALLSLPLEISVFIKAPVVIFISWMLTWLFSTLILTKMPVLRDIF